MARSVASIAVSVVARTEKFRKGMQRAMRTLKKFGAGVRAMSVRVAKFGAVLTGVATGALVLFVKQSFKSLDALAKTSAKLGIGIDQLRGLERAAELTGGSIEQFRKSIVMMSKNINEAAGGTGEALEAFKDLRVNVQDLVQLGPDRALITILKALDLIPGRIRKIGIASDIFGARSGTALLNLAALGPQLEREIERSIQLVGRFTDVELNLVERANDALGDTFRSLRGIADRLAVTIAPVVERIANALTNAFIGFRENLTSSILPALRRFFIQALNFAELFFRSLKLQITDIKIEALTAIAEVLLALGRDPTRLLAARNKAKFQSIRPRETLDLLASGRLPLLGDRLAKSLDDMIAGAAGAFQRAQVERAKRQLKNFFAPVLNAVRDPLSAFGAIMENLNKRLEPFRGKLRFRPSAVEPESFANAARFLTVSLSRQALRAFPGQKREQIVRDRSVEAAIREQTRFLRGQGSAVVFGV